jgi:hypothetical protein
MYAKTEDLFHKKLNTWIEANKKSLEKSKKEKEKRRNAIASDANANRVVSMATFGAEASGAGATDGAVGFREDRGPLWPQEPRGRQLPQGPSGP